MSYILHFYATLFGAERLMIVILHGSYTSPWFRMSDTNITAFPSFLLPLSWTFGLIEEFAPSKFSTLIG